jgi:predicted ArsR family transcriptional regulator
VAVNDSAPERALSPDEFNAAVTAVTNAFGDPTRREIYLYVRDHAVRDTEPSGTDTAGSSQDEPGLTAADVAQQFDLHPNVARHHLEKLSGGGYLTVAIARGDEGSGARPAGRPSKRYRASELDHALALPLRHDDILATLLVRALDALGPEEAEALADEVGFEYGRTLAERMEPGEGHRSARTALAAVAEALTAHGFASHAESSGDDLSIVSECCPFGDTATRYPHVVCALDRGMIRGMLARLYGETSPRFDVSRPDGADHCVARV